MKAHFLSKIVLRGLLIVTAIIVIDFAQVCTFYFKDHPPTPSFTPPSVTTVGYNMLRSGSTTSSINPDDPFISLQKKESSALADGAKYMPTYLNGHSLPEQLKKRFPQIANRDIIFFATKHEHIKAVDINSGEVLWEVADLPVHSSPYLIPSFGKLYFKNYRVITSINLDGTEANTISLDIASKMPPGTTSKNSFCNTALGFNSKYNYLFWGCSGENYQDDDFNYGKKGSVGYLVALYLGKFGNFISNNNFKLYIPTQITSSPFSGFNTGIWNVGSGPTLLDDNETILISTGNGPFNPDTKNWGCSLLRLNAKSFQLDTNTPNFVGLNDRGFDECFHLNIDLASSAVSSIKHKDRYYSISIAKNGIFFIVDPLHIPKEKDRQFQQITYAQKETHFGQANLYVQEEKLHALMTTSLRPWTFPNLLATPDTIKKISEITKYQYYQQQCIGYISSVKTNAAPLSIYYSGRIRKNLLLAPDDSKFTHTLINPKAPYFMDKYHHVYNPHYSGPKFWPNFKKILSIGYSVPANYMHKHFILQDIAINTPNPLFMLFAQPLAEVQNDQETTIMEQYKILRTPGNNPCALPAPPNFKKVFNYSQAKDRPLKAPWYINSVTIDSNNQHRVEWTYYPSSQDTILPNTNYAVATTPDQKSGYAIITAQKLNSDKSELNLINTKTGKLIAKHEFIGALHFSMPLIVDKKIFIATKDHGIRQFILKNHYFPNYLRARSFLLNALF